MITRSVLRELMSMVLRQLFKEVAILGDDLYDLWLDPCTRACFAALMRRRAQKRGWNVRRKWWAWREGRLRLRCMQLKRPSNTLCSPENAIAIAIGRAEKLFA